MSRNHTCRKVHPSLHLAVSPAPRCCDLILDNQCRHRSPGIPIVGLASIHDLVRRPWPNILQSLQTAVGHKVGRVTCPDPKLYSGMMPTLLVKPVSSRARPRGAIRKTVFAPSGLLRLGGRMVTAQEAYHGRSHLSKLPSRHLYEHTDQAMPRHHVGPRVTLRQAPAPYD